MGEVRRRGGAVQVTLTVEEASVLAALATQVAALLEPEDDTSSDPDPLEALVDMPTDPVVAPDDPALRRLLPDAYGDDDAAAGEFRRLMEADLRRQKTDALRDLLDAVPLGEAGSVTLQLNDEAAERWLQALTDVRLVTGTRLDVTEELDQLWDSLEPDDPRKPLLIAYDWLGWLQESIVNALDG